MIYSKEVEEMCTVAQGVNHGCAPIPEEANWVKVKEVKDISGLTHGVGCLQAHIECERGYHSGSTGRDYRMLRHDPFRSYGSRDLTGKDSDGSIEYRPCMRCHQYCHERIVLTDCIRKK